MQADGQTTAAPDPGGPADRGPDRARSRRDRAAELALPILLAALGLFGALIAWRTTLAGDAASEANASALAAARAHAAAVVDGEAQVARTMEAWLDYERARRRAEALIEAGYPRTAFRDSSISAGHYVMVDAAYLDANGQYDPERHRQALLAEAASRTGLDPAPHIAEAEREAERGRALVLAGIVAAAALPLLTIGEIVRARLRRLATLAGTVAFGAGVVLAVLAW